MTSEDAPAEPRRHRDRRPRRQWRIPAAPGGDTEGIVLAVRRRIRPWRLAGSRLVAAALGLFLGWGIYQAPFTFVDEMEVAGNRHVSAEQVQEVSQVEGQPILALDVEQVKTTLRGLPWVKHVALRRQLPSKVAILLEEREPRAVWQTDGAAFLVDEAGLVLGAAEPEHGLPLITDRDKLAVEPGQRVSEEAVRLAVKLTELLPLTMGTQAKSFEYTRVLDGGLVVAMATGQQARFGGEEELAVKLATWKAILQEGDRMSKRVHHVDLRFGARPFLR